MSKEFIILNNLRNEIIMDKITKSRFYNHNWMLRKGYDNCLEIIDEELKELRKK